MKRLSLLSVIMLFLAAFTQIQSQNLKINDLEYFETQGVNVLVYSNLFTGGFNDEKNAGIELIHHGVRTVQGGAVRLSNTPEQWDLVPAISDRKVDRSSNSIEASMRYNDYDFDSRVVVTPKVKALRLLFTSISRFLLRWKEKPVLTLNFCPRNTGKKPI